MERINKWRKENPEKRQLQRKRERIRRSLCKLGILPQPNQEMTDEQLDIYNQIGRDDYSFWDSLKGVKRRKYQWKSLLLSDDSEKYNLIKRAEHSKRDCDIDISDIEIPEYCPYLNIKLSTNIEDCNGDNYYSIDRIDSSKGYVKGNVQIISRLANTMKNNATIEQLLVFAENIKRLYGENPN